MKEVRWLSICARFGGISLLYSLCESGTTFLAARRPAQAINMSICPGMVVRVGERDKLAVYHWIQACLVCHFPVTLSVRLEPRGSRPFTNAGIASPFHVYEPWRKGESSENPVLFPFATMLFLNALAFVSIFVAMSLAQDAPVLTAEVVFQEIVDEPPFLVARTTSTTWTQSPSIIEPDTITTTTLPTGI